MITKKQVFQFVEGNFKMLGDKLDLLQEHTQEQVLYRTEICKKDCMKTGYCIKCGCSVPGKMYVTKSCNDGMRFPDLMTIDEWSEFKKENNIVIEKYRSK